MISFEIYAEFAVLGIGMHTMVEISMLCTGGNKNKLSNPVTG
jgi:hypothetical protein